MAVKAGKIILPASGPFAITGLGFEPQLILFTFTDNPSEGSWRLTGVKSWGFGIASRKNTNDPTVMNAGSSVTVDDVTAGGSFNALIGWARATRSGGGYAFFVESFDADGFTMDYSAGFAAGASGKFLYYMAFGEVQNVGQGWFYEGKTSESLGWQPDAVFAAGSGSASNNPPVPPNFATNWADLDATGEAISQGFFETGNQSSLLYQMSAVVQNDEEGGFYNVIGDEFITLASFAAGGLLTTVVDVPIRRTATTIESSGEGGTRLSIHALGGVKTDSVSHFPTTSIGIDEELPIGSTFDIVPEAAIIFADQGSWSNFTSAFDNEPWHGGRSIGFVTADFKCVAAYGVEDQNSPPGSDPRPGSASFCESDNRTWIANLIEPTRGVNVSSGTLDLGPGAKVTCRTLENGKSMQNIYIWVIGTKKRKHLLPILHVGA